MKQILTTTAPNPAGHYSQAIVHQGLVYVSGQLPINLEIGPRTKDQPLPSIQEQINQVLKNLEEILVASGSSLDRVLKATVYISDISLWPEVNQVYAQVFNHHKPARAVVPVNDLHFGYQIEVEAIGYV
jgi:2-iminobutanoate/2-iminopropanoate deaminase